ncbi:MAG: cyclic nucleotide-binding domain-containing protein [Anaerolineales bacterium]|nr:cyclic nucleotide-binding domain-containing protein [Anaerolineales bacterium]
MINIPERVAFLKRLHIFHGLEDDQLLIIARNLDERRCTEQEVIVKQDDEGDSFFLVYQGRVDVVLRQGQHSHTLGTLIAGDYFGEEALLKNRRRTASVIAREATTFLVFTRNVFNKLLQDAPKLRPNLEVAVESRRLIRRTRFKWVRPGEVIYFLARKHPIILYQSLAGPFFALIIPLFALLFFTLMDAVLPLLLAGISLLAILGWAGWKWLDWTNDYYIVTNQRVIWLEKVIGVYDSRHEAPLSTILSVGIERSEVGRILDFGTVVVRTFVGRIPFENVHRPQPAAWLIEEHWSRSRAGTRQADVEAMKRSIRDKLGLVNPEASEPAVQLPEAVRPLPSRSNVLRIMIANLFRIRIEETGGTITYRKHPYVLFRQTWQPGLALIALLGLIIYRLSLIGLRSDTILVLLLFFLSLAFVWWFYQYVDWRNDTFQVTQDQIFDVDRTPLGREERKSASLDNILSTEYKREGLLQVLLNFGNVYITVGGTQFIFEDVLDPPAVQQDIDQRRIARIEAKRQTELAAERERMASWLATYHQNSEELRHEQDLKDLNEGAI